MTHRYYVPDLPAAGGSLPLPTAEAHHARTVMRVRSGEVIELFDGAGRVAEACIESVDKRQIVCELQPPREDSRMPARQVILGVGLPKGDRAKFLIEKLTELGVAQCVPLHCQRSQWSPSKGAIEKWQRAMIEACKQSGRNHLMPIEQPVDAVQWFHQAAEVTANRMLAHPRSAPAGDASQSVEQAWAERSAKEGRPDWIAVGPEGGFTEEEVAAARSAGWLPISLGQLVYRIETAAIALASIAIHR